MEVYVREASEILVFHSWPETGKHTLGTQQLTDCVGCLCRCLPVWLECLLCYVYICTHTLHTIVDRPCWLFMPLSFCLAGIINLIKLFIVYFAMHVYICTHYVLFCSFLSFLVGLTFFLFFFFFSS